jgi:oligopeptide/dipeptide ABC transporter ATP-binding protein
MNGLNHQDTRGLLEIRDLTLHFPGQQRPAVQRVSFSIPPGRTLGLVGGSGAGKSSIARLVTRLLKADSGEILYRGNDITKMDTRQLLTYRQNVQIVFQEPSASLSPRRTVQQTLLEPLNHFVIGDAEHRRQRIGETLSTVGLDDTTLQRYPHQLSSGQQQRVAIARALVSGPELVIADEAVSSLDVSVQAQILQLIRSLQDERGIAFLFISHDLGVIRQIADQVGVMFRGHLVEHAPAESFFKQPAHPYSRSLLSCARNDLQLASHDQWQLESGVEIGDDPATCVFLRDCPLRLAVCERDEPNEHCIETEKPHDVPAHCVKCHLYDETDSNENRESDG